MGSTHSKTEAKRECRAVNGLGEVAARVRTAIGQIEVLVVLACLTEQLGRHARLPVGEEGLVQRLGAQPAARSHTPRYPRQRTNV